MNLFEKRTITDFQSVLDGWQITAKWARLLKVFIFIDCKYGTDHIIVPFLVSKLLRNMFTFVMHLVEQKTKK